MCSQCDWTADEQRAWLDTTSEEVKMGFLEGPHNEVEMFRASWRALTMKLRCPCFLELNNGP